MRVRVRVCACVVGVGAPRRQQAATESTREQRFARIYSSSTRGKDVIQPINPSSPSEDVKRIFAPYKYHVEPNIN